MRGNGRAVIAAAVGDLSGRDSVVICGNSLSLKRERPSDTVEPPGTLGLGRTTGAIAGSTSRCSEGPAEAVAAAGGCAKPSSTGRLSALELLRDRG